jgi:hypothetical protein
MTANQGGAKEKRNRKTKEKKKRENSSPQLKQ